MNRTRLSAYGISLAELIVAGAIGSLAILVLVGVLRKGLEIAETTQHRQRARAIIDSCFESSRYQRDNFVNMPAFDSVAVLIDPRSGTSLYGSLTVSVIAGVHTTPLISSGIAARDNVSYKRIEATVAWREQQGAETVALQKTLTALDF
jgi:hypothetical protein